MPAKYAYAVGSQYVKVGGTACLVILHEKFGTMEKLGKCAMDKKVLNYLHDAKRR
jgi:hypothetical protein